ncbi:MAG TPA: hypothetical protein VMO78_17080 [Rhizomicrobium sp.]|nr:hypothetical protein [Rhizomicrobium sp.]
MRVWTAAMLVLVLGASATKAEDCTLKQYTSVPMEVYPDHLLIPVTLGTTQAKLLFQMAAAANGINSDVAEKLDLYITSIPPNIHFNRDGEDIRRIAHVPELHLGSQTLKGMEFLMLRPGRYGGGVVGDLGTHMFEHVDFELDMAGGKLNLFSPDHCPGKAVYWTKSGFAQLPLKPSKELGFIRAEMTLDGHPVTVAFTTTGRSRIGMNAMRAFFNIDETSPDLVAVSQDLLGHKLYKYPFKTLTAAGLTVTNPDILVFDQPPEPGCSDKAHFTFPEPSELHSTAQPRLTRCFGGDDAVLGLSVLSKLHIYVSGQENMLYLTDAKAN